MSSNIKNVNRILEDLGGDIDYLCPTNERVKQTSLENAWTMPYANERLFDRDDNSIIRGYQRF